MSDIFETNILLTYNLFLTKINIIFLTVGALEGVIDIALKYNRYNFYYR